MVRAEQPPKGIQAVCPSRHERACSIGQCIVGGRDFIEKIIKPELKDNSELKEIQKRQRLIYRPKLDELFPAKEQGSIEERDKAIMVSHIEYGYTLSEIARYLGRHYTTFSKIVKKGLYQD